MAARFLFTILAITSSALAQHPPAPLEAAAAAYDARQFVTRFTRDAQNNELREWSSREAALACARLGSLKQTIAGLRILTHAEVSFIGHVTDPFKIVQIRLSDARAAADRFEEVCQPHEDSRGSLDFAKPSQELTRIVLKVANALEDVDAQHVMLKQDLNEITRVQAAEVLARTANMNRFAEAKTATGHASSPVGNIKNCFLVGSARRAFNDLVDPRLRTASCLKVLSPARDQMESVSGQCTDRSGAQPGQFSATDIDQIRELGAVTHGQALLCVRAGV